MVGYAPQNTNISNGFQNSLAKILNKGNFIEEMKLPPPPKPQVVNFDLSLPGAPTGGISTGNTSLDQLMRAIKGKESGGNYSATNPSGASGAYQILRSNFEGSGKGWDIEALGRDINYNEFMGSRQIQDQIARYKLGQFLQKYGAAGAAATWYGGTWGREHMHDKSPQNGYPSMYEYVQAILRNAR